MKTLSLLVANCALVLLTGCAGPADALAQYNSTVASRSDSLSGYSKDSGSAGAAYTHTVNYR